MISLSLLQASGGYALFKLMRDAVVVWRLSLAEEMLKNAWELPVASNKSAHSFIVF